MMACEYHNRILTCHVFVNSQDRQYGSHIWDVIWKSGLLEEEDQTLLEHTHPAWLQKGTEGESFIKYYTPR